MRTIKITQAAAHSEGATIVIQSQDLEGYGPKGLGELFRQEGVTLADTLFHTLPGGTVEALADELQRLFRGLSGHE